MNYFPFHVGDYAAHTAHLEPMEDLAYRRLLDAYYLREGPLPSEIQVTAKLVRMRSMAADVESVLREFFTLTDEGWAHRRCDAEIAKMQDKQAKARESAAASVNARQARAQANVERTLREKQADAERSLAKEEADVELPTPTPTPTPTPLLVVAKTPRPTKKAPSGFLLSAELRAWAAEHAPHCDPAVELEKLKDHTFATARTDWAGTLRNWLRKAEENHASAPRSKVVGLNGDQWAGAI